jgi:hypothetical protein
MNKSDSDFRPHVREDGLVIHELEDETLVYDLESHKAHCLNQTAALVWKHCNGETTVGDLAKQLKSELAAPVNDDLVWYALERLGKANLLRERVARPLGTAGASRRAALRKLGWAAAVSLPLVTSILAPTAASAATCVKVCPPPKAGNGKLCQSCKGNHCCDEGLCLNKNQTAFC